MKVPAQDQGVAAQPVVIVTGLSGAGRTTAVSALEDLGFEVLNNFPLAFIGRLLAAGQAEGRPLAIGVTTRTRGFSAAALGELLDRLRGGEGPGALLVFLDAADEALLTRFNATRRPHPLAPAEDPAIGIARERALLAPLRARADLVIDTTALNPHELRAEVTARFASGVGRGMAVSIQSFSVKRGAPHGAGLVVDCRFLRNPYWDPALRGLDGRDERIQGFVRADPLFAPFFARLRELLEVVLPASREEGKAWFAIALGCTGGRHRSVAVAEMLAETLRGEGWLVTVRHPELESEGDVEGAGRAGEGGREA